MMLNFHQTLKNTTLSMDIFSALVCVKNTSSVDLNIATSFGKKVFSLKFLRVAAWWICATCFQFYIRGEKKQ